MLKLYKCKVRLHGDVRDECRKKNVTAGEIRILQQIHGNDSVLEVTPTGETALSEIPEHTHEHRGEVEERERLSRIYGEAVVNKMFGVKPVSITSEIVASIEPEETFVPPADQPPAGISEARRRGRPPNAARDLVA